jgi:hypothetical protein
MPMTVILPLSELANSLDASPQSEVAMEPRSPAETAVLP